MEKDYWLKNVEFFKYFQSKYLNKMKIDLDKQILFVRKILN